MNNVRILLFANLREKTGTSSVDVSLPDGATIAVLLTWLKERYPQIRPHLTEKIVISINHKIALSTTPIPQDAEVALMPPVGGGNI